MAGDADYNNGITVQLSRWLCSDDQDFIEEVIQDTIARNAVYSRESAYAARRDMMVDPPGEPVAALITVTVRFRRKEENNGL